MNTQPSDLVELGVLHGSYGLLGWAHLQPHVGNGDTLRKARQWWLFPPTGPTPVSASTLPATPAAGMSVSVTGIRLHGQALVAKWQGCDTPEAAQAFKGWRVAVSRSEFPALPEGEFYILDLVGLSVVNRQNQTIGTVAAVRSNGAHDFLEVVRPDRDEPALIPQVPAYVDQIDLGARCIRVDWELDW